MTYTQFSYLKISKNKIYSVSTRGVIKTLPDLKLSEREILNKYIIGGGLGITNRGSLSQIRRSMFFSIDLI